MTVSELIKELQNYPADGVVSKVDVTVQMGMRTSKLQYRAERRPKKPSVKENRR